jgi:hypothetical protein
MVRSCPKEVTKFPSNPRGGRKVNQDSRKNVNPRVIQLTKISPSHKGGTILSNFDKVEEKSLP